MKETTFHAIPRFHEGSFINSGPNRGSFAVRDHLRSSLGIISGLGIIWGRGSFAALYSSRKWLLKDLNSNMEYYIQLTE